MHVKKAQMQAGGVFREINRFSQALEFFQQAVKLKPADEAAVTSLGDTLFDLKKYEEAATEYQKVLQSNPKNAIVRMDLGLSYFLREPRNLDQAIAEFRTALKIDSRHEKALQNLTAALIEKGDIAGARQSLDQLESINPQNPTIATFRGKLSR